MKKFLALLLSAMLIATTVAVPLSASAESADNSTSTDTDMSVEGSNSFGNLLADEMQEVMPENDEGDPEYGITDVIVEGNKATVSYYAALNCTIVVALYDEESGEMLASGNADVSAETTSADIIIDTDSMPEYFALKAFIIDSQNNPLSDSYATGIYTEAIQTVKNMEVSDFDSDEVLNLDEDETTNFAVFADGTKIIPYTENYNIPVDTSPSDNVYVFTNCNDDFKSLSIGDAVSYTYGNEVILIKIADITVDGDTVTIKNEDNTDMETFFNYVKIEGEATTADVVYDGTGADESVTFEGLVNENDQVAGGMYSSGDGSLSTNLSLKFKIGEGKIEGNNKSSDNDNGSYVDGSLNLNAEVKLSIAVKVDFYYNSSWNPIKNLQELKNAELKFSSDIKINFDGGFTAQGSLNSLKLGSFKIFPALGVSVDFTPRVKFSASVAVNFSAVVEKHFAFSYSFAEGLNDASTPLKVEFSVKISGEIYLGVDFGPKINLLSEELVNVKLTLEAGARVTASISESTEHTDHLCKTCVSGDVIGVVKFGISINLFNIKSSNDSDSDNTDSSDENDNSSDSDNSNNNGNSNKGKKSRFSIGEDFSLEHKFADYYYSIDYGDAGFGKCPHYMKFHENETTALVDEGTCGDDVKWALYESGTLYIYGSGDMEDYDDSFVCMAPWQSYINQITNVVIEHGVTSIGNGAFVGCESLTSGIIPNSVTSIGEAAFWYCRGMTSITIPDSVTNIGKNAFGYCISLTSITIPNSVTSIEDGVFSNCTGATSITIPNSVASIGWGAFRYCIALSCITIPNSVTSIEDYAFGYCRRLTSVTISDSVQNIGNYVFAWCDRLTSITIPDSVTSLGNFAISYCESLSSVTIGNGVTSLESFSISYCKSLTCVTIGNSVSNISGTVFEGCNSLININVSPSNNYYTSLDGVVFNKNLTEITTYPKGKTGEYTIPNSVTRIGESAFSGCSSLTSVTIPNSVTNIGSSAFSGCNALRDVYFTGTEQEWKNIQVDEENGCLINANIHYNYSPATSSSIVPKATVLDISVKSLDNNTAEKTEERFSGLKANGQYILMVVRSKDVEKLVTSDNLVYINQYKADEDGKLTVEYTADADGDLTTLIFGVGADNVQLDTPDEPVNESDTDTQTETDVDTSVDTESDMDTETDTQSDSDIQTNTESDTDTQTDTDYNTDTDEPDTPDTPDSPDNPNPPKTYTKGDITADGKITASDALVILRAAVGAGTLTEEEKQIADINGDGKITAADALMVLRYAVGIRDNSNAGKVFEFVV